MVEGVLWKKLRTDDGNRGTPYYTGSLSDCIMSFSIQNAPWVATMQSNGKFGREMDLVEPKAAMRKFDRGMYGDYPFDEQGNATEQENPLISMIDCVLLYLRIMTTSEFVH